jgi:hypothetical protein
MIFDGVGGLFDRCFSSSLSIEACFCSRVAILGVFGVNWLDLLLGRLFGGRRRS